MWIRDTDDVQDRLRTPSPVTIIGEPTPEAAEEAPPAWQNRCLVPERVLEANAKPHQEGAPDQEEKEKQEHSLGREQSTPVVEDDVVVLYEPLHYQSLLIFRRFCGPKRGMN